MASEGRAGASASADLPGSFFSPAPIRSTRLSEERERRYRKSKTVRLAVLRAIALGAAVPWLLAVLAGWFTRGTQTPAELGVRLVFCAACLGVIGAAVRHRERTYVTVFLLVGGVYCAALAVHVGYILATGESPLSGSYLGDYSGLPAALLATALPVRLGLLAAAGVVAVAAAFNLDPALTWSTPLEIAHAELMILPFLFFLQAARATSRRLDDAASRAHTEAVRETRTKTLAELETRFLGYLHDRILGYLTAVGRGVEHEWRTDPDEDLPELLERKDRASLADEITDLVARASEIAPELAVDLPDRLPDRATLPANAAAALHDAALEAVRNTTDHAPGAPASLGVEVSMDEATCTAVSITVHDEGPGFDPDAVAANRAGLRVSVVGRMEATEGCDVALRSVPGDGTTVRLTWSLDGPGSVTPETESVAVPDIYQLLGFARVLRPGIAVLAWLVFVALSLNDGHHAPALYLVSLVALAVAVRLLIRGTRFRLPLPETLGTAAAVVVFFVAAAIDAEAAEMWPRLWYPWVLILLCTYLTLRDRAGFAWATWAVCLTLAEVLVGLGVVDPAGAAAQIAQASLVLVVGTLLPPLLKLTVRGLPVALELRRSRATTAEQVAARSSFIADSRRWLSGQVSAALDPGLTETTRRANASLLAQRLRDSIRSPHFDEPALNRAIWDARSRGTVVSLLDDGADGSPPETDLHRELAAVLLDESAERVTARILPPGRTARGTIVVHAGGETRRIEIDGARPHANG